MNSKNRLWLVSHGEYLQARVWWCLSILISLAIGSTLSIATFTFKKKFWRRIHPWARSFQMTWIIRIFWILHNIDYSRIYRHNDACVALRGDARIRISKCGSQHHEIRVCLRLCHAWKIHTHTGHHFYRRCHYLSTPSRYRISTFYRLWCLTIYKMYYRALSPIQNTEELFPLTTLTCLGEFYAIGRRIYDYDAKIFDADRLISRYATKGVDRVLRFTSLI